jgi:asparagine synthase (glutamine-hydrolysing)
MRVLAEKYLLKKAAKSLLPDSIIQRPKQPYRAPDGVSFATTHSPGYVAELLSRESILRDGIFDPSPVHTLAAEFRSGRAMSAKDNMALVGVISTQLLMQRFVAPHRTTTYAVN